MNRYTQLTRDERVVIATLSKQRRSQSEIARTLGRHRSTICREFQRNRCVRDGGYRHFKAQSRTNGRRRRSRKKPQYSEAQLRLVSSQLKLLWSPEQISVTLAQSGSLQISHETIYRHIWWDRYYGGVLHTYLRGARKQRRKRNGSYDSRGRMAGKRMIDERPQAINDRKDMGHWEIDTVMGKGSKDCIVTLVERKTGYTVIGKLPNRTTAALNACVIRLMSKHQDRFITVTSDNGTEFHQYKEIEKATGVTFYFSHPYHSWERGTNENTNGLIRQYLPKGTSMAKVTQKDCDKIAQSLNQRPRKRHGFRTPEGLYANS